MARTPISRSSPSLKVKLWSCFFSLYNWTSLKLSPWSPYTHFIVFYSQSLEVLIAHTGWPIKRIINTHSAYKYLDNAGGWHGPSNQV